MSIFRLLTLHMSKFITTTEISYIIEKMIKDADEFIFIITPYLKIHPRLKAVIEEKLSECKSYFQIIVVCKESELHYKNPDELKWLKSLPKLKLFNSFNLHAKCYLNETHAIITSMNLYDFSQVNNIEFGMVVQKDDTDYNKIVKEVSKISAKDIIKEIQLCKLEYQKVNSQIRQSMVTSQAMADAQVKAALAGLD